MLTNRQFNLLLDDLALPFDDGTAKLRDYQKYIMNDWRNHKLNALINARQIGASTMIIIDAIIQALEGKNVVIISTKQNISKLHKNMTTSIIDNNNLTDYLIVDNSTCLKFENGGYVEFFSDCSYLRGKGFDKVYVVDFDYWEQKKDFMYLMMPLISSRKSSSLVIQGTPSKSNGISQFINNPRFHTTIVNYDVIEEHNSEWVRNVPYFCSGEVFTREFDMSPYIKDIIK